MGYKWNKNGNESSIKFHEAQKSQSCIKNLTDILNDTYSTLNDALRLNNELTGIFKSLSNASLKRKKPPTYKNNNPWFDFECRLAKRKLSILAKKYGKNPLDIPNRTIYYDRRKQYKDLIKSKKANYVNTMNEILKMEKF